MPEEFIELTDEQYNALTPQQQAEYNGKKAAFKQQQAGAQYSDAMTEAQIIAQKALESQAKTISNNYDSAIRDAKAAHISENATFADIVGDIKREHDEAKAAAQLQNRTNYNSAVFTGATEFASAIANLFGVGAGASNQQFKTYSQDWMRKAEADSRENRSRIEAARNRERAARLEQIQMKVRQAKELRDLGMARDAALSALTTKDIDLGYGNAVDRAKTNLSTALTAASSAMQGANAGTQMRFHAEESAKTRDFQEKEKAKDRALERENRTIKLSMQGFDKNGNLSEEKIKQRQEIMAKYPSFFGKTTEGSGKNEYVRHPFINEDGKIDIANLEKDEIEYIYSTAKEAIIKDLEAADAEKKVKKANKSTANAFKSKWDKAKDDSARRDLINEYIGKSSMAVELLHAMDPTYTGAGSSSSSESGPATNNGGMISQADFDKEINGLGDISDAPVAFPAAAPVPEIEADDIFDFDDEPGGASSSRQPSPQRVSNLKIRGDVQQALREANKHHMQADPNGKDYSEIIESPMALGRMLKASNSQRNMKGAAGWDERLSTAENLLIHAGFKDLLNRIPQSVLDELNTELENNARYGRK